MALLGIWSSLLVYCNICCFLIILFIYFYYFDSFLMHSQHHFILSTIISPLHNKYIIHIRQNYYPFIQAVPFLRSILCNSVLCISLSNFEILWSSFLCSNSRKFIPKMVGNFVAEMLIDYQTNLFFTITYVIIKLLLTF